MGRKNKNKDNEPPKEGGKQPQDSASEKKTQESQQKSRGGQNPQQSARDDWRGQQPSQQGGGQSQQKGRGGQNPQQSARDDWRGQQPSQQGGGQSQQKGRGGQNPQQSTRDDWRGQQPSQQGGRQQQQPSQPGAWGGGQKQQSSQQGGGDGGRQQQQPSQQGAWGGGQRQQSSQQVGGRQQQQPSQQGAWGGGQRQQSSQQGGGDGGRQQQQPSQQGAWGQRQQSSQQGGGDGGRQQQQPSQQGAWGGGQRQQSSQQGGGDGGRQQQQPSQQSAWSAGQRQQSSQQRGGGDGGRQQQQQYQQGDRGNNQQQQRSQPQYQQRGGGGGGGDGPLSHNMAQLSISNETPVPTKIKSCNNIVRGTLGRSDIVEVNYLKLDLSNMPNEAYHYDVTIIPDRPKKFLRPAFEQCVREAFPNIGAAFDGMKSCYTLKRLPTPIDRKISIADSGGRMKEFQVQIKETDTCVVDLNVLRTYQNERVFDKPMRALQVLEVVMASNNHKLGIRVGRSFFRKPENPYNLDDGYEAWTGLYQAAILGEEPLLNVDIAHKSFPGEATLIEYLQRKQVDLTRSLGGRDISDIKNYLQGINILYTPPNSFGSVPRTYKVLNIGDPADATRFRTDDGKEQTVANYFSSRGYRLKYPKLNCIKVGSTVKQIALPMELCSIPGGQALNRKDKEKQVSNMIRFAATSTNTRKAKIMDLLNYFKHNDNDMIREFGLRIGSSFIKVPMRLLPQPYMEYLQGRTVTTFKGAWRMDNMKFLITSKPPNGHKWAIIYEEGKCRRSYHDLKDFMNSVVQASRGLNMNLQDNAEILGYSYKDIQTKFRSLAAEKYDLVFVVLSDFGTPYSKIKQTAELEIGILTQCIKEKTIFRTGKDRTVFSNILLKVNGKLNGTNHKIAPENDSKLKELMKPIDNVMYLGADVTHPSPDQSHIPSVVGVAASHDMYGACYNCQYRLQTSKNECIEDMESIVLKHLEMYNKYQKKYPTKIIYYRDGVSDGQFPQIKREEVRSIKNACKRKGCDPKLTCIIVVKRHHTRFFPLTAPRDSRDFNNVQPGSVVDQHITHPNEVQFFMVSHQSIQGTAKPTRYNVIVDESSFDINLLQKLTYNLCHLFPRCNRPVSYPAPAYLAHLVAFRGRVYIEGTFKFDRNLQKEYERRLIKPDFMNKNPMYFI